MTSILLFIIKAYLAAILIVATVSGAAVAIPVFLIVVLWMSFRKYFSFGTFTE